MLHAYMYMRLTGPVNVIFDRFASSWLSISVLVLSQYC